MDWVGIALVVSFFGSIGIITGALAARKGYEFLPWMFAGGILGLVVLAFLPFANAPGLSDPERINLVENGNRMGRRLAVVSIGLVLFRALALG